MAVAEKKLLYKIGTGWIFDLSTNTGYKVERTGGRRKGKVTGYTKAFDLVFWNNGSAEVRYSMTVPIGAVRKALHLLELRIQGKLGEYNE